MRRIRKRIFTALLALAMVCSLLPAAAPAAYAEELGLQGFGPDTTEKPTGTVRGIRVLSSGASIFEVDLTDLELGKEYAVSCGMEGEIACSEEKFTADSTEKTIVIDFAGGSAEDLRHIRGDIWFKLTYQKERISEWRFWNFYFQDSQGQWSINFKPDAFCADRSSFPFQFRLNGLWRRDGNNEVLMLDEYGNVAGRGKDLNVIFDEAASAKWSVSRLVTGTMELTKEFDRVQSSGAGYHVVVNGKDIDANISYHGELATKNYITEGFNVGVLDLNAKAINSSGRCRFLICSEKSTSSPKNCLLRTPVCSGGSPDGDWLSYAFRYTNEELDQALQLGSMYQVWLQDEETGAVTSAGMIDYQLSTGSFYQPAYWPEPLKDGATHLTAFARGLDFENLAVMQACAEGAKLELCENYGNTVLETVPLQNIAVDIPWTAAEGSRIRMQADVEKPLTRPAEGQRYYLNFENARYEVDFEPLPLHFEKPEAQVSYTVDFFQGIVQGLYPPDSVYTGELYIPDEKGDFIDPDDYTRTTWRKLSTEPFPMTRYEWDASESTMYPTYLAFDPDAAGVRFAGEMYLVRVYQDGIARGSASSVLQASDVITPRFELTDGSGAEKEVITHTVRSRDLTLRLSDFVDYPWVKISLEGHDIYGTTGSYARADALGELPIMLSAGNGNKQLQLIFSTNEKGTAETLTLSRTLYLWENSLLGLAVEDKEWQGGYHFGVIAPLKAGKKIQLECTLEMRYSTGVDLCFKTDDGAECTVPMVSGVFAFDPDQTFICTLPGGGTRVCTARDFTTTTFRAKYRGRYTGESITKRVRYVPFQKLKYVAAYDTTGGQLPENFPEGYVVSSLDEANSTGLYLPLYLPTPKNGQPAAYEYTIYGIGDQNLPMPTENLHMTASGPNVGRATIHRGKITVQVEPNDKAGPLDLWLTIRYAGGTHYSGNGGFDAEVLLGEHMGAGSVRNVRAERHNTATDVSWETAGDVAGLTVITPGGLEIPQDPASLHVSAEGHTDRGLWQVKVKGGNGQITRAAFDNGLAVRPVGGTTVPDAPAVLPIYAGTANSCELVMLEPIGNDRVVSGQPVWSILAGDTTGVTLEGNVVTVAAGAAERTLTVQGELNGRIVQEKLRLKAVNMETEYVVRPEVSQGTGGEKQVEITITPPETPSVPVIVMMTRYGPDGRMQLVTSSDVLEPGMAPETLAMRYFKGDTVRVFLVDTVTGQALCEPMLPQS